MKLITAIVEPFKLEDVKAASREVGQAGIPAVADVDTAVRVRTGEMGRDGL